MTVVSDTSPLRFSAPQTVRQWTAQRPAWLEIRDLPRPPEPELTRRLDRGEAEAIQLAIDLRADFLLIDEYRGRRMATERGATVIGALGILLESYRQGLVQAPLDLLVQLRANRFRVSQRLIQEFEEQVRLIGSRK